ncbi:MAG TPA: hypothetical protein DCQ31_11060 [Bacteroidales bacterium]|nr:hypothetical protein [Bacteroidales bacterium]
MKTKLMYLLYTAIALFIMGYFLKVSINNHNNTMNKAKLPIDGVKSKAVVSRILSEKSIPLISYAYTVKGKEISAIDDFVKGRDEVLKENDSIWIIYLPEAPETSGIKRDLAGNPMIFK